MLRRTHNDLGGQRVRIYAIDACLTDQRIHEYVYIPPAHRQPNKCLVTAVLESRTEASVKIGPSHVPLYSTHRLAFKER